MVSLPGISLLFLFFSDSFPFCLIHYMLPNSPFSCLFSPLFLYVLFSLTVLVTVAWERVNGEFHTSFLIFCLEIGHTPCPHTSTDTANHRSIPNFKMDVLLDERGPGEEGARWGGHQVSLPELSGTHLGPQLSLSPEDLQIRISRPSESLQQITLPFFALAAGKLKVRCAVHP